MRPSYSKTENDAHRTSHIQEAGDDEKAECRFHWTPPGTPTGSLARGALRARHPTARAMDCQPGRATAPGPEGPEGTVSQEWSTWLRHTMRYETALVVRWRFSHDISCELTRFLWSHEETEAHGVRFSAYSSRFGRCKMCVLQPSTGASRSIFASAPILLDVAGECW